MIHTFGYRFMFIWPMLQVSLRYAPGIHGRCLGFPWYMLRVSFVVKAHFLSAAPTMTQIRLKEAPAKSCKISNRASGRIANFLTGAEACFPGF